MITETAFLRREHRVCLPDEQALAIEIASKKKISPGDVKVSYPVVKEVKRVVVLLREKEGF